MPAWFHGIELTKSSTLKKWMLLPYDFFSLSRTFFLNLAHFASILNLLKYLYYLFSSWILWRKSQNHSIMDHNVFLFVILHFDSFVSNVFEFLASFISYCNIAKFDSGGSRSLPIHSRIHSLVNLQGQKHRGNEHFAEDCQME